MKKPIAKRKVARCDAPPMIFMVTDSKFNYVLVSPGTDLRQGFKDFHGYYPKRFAVHVCHPETKWDGCGGYSIPQGAWIPLLVWRSHPCKGNV